MPFNAIYDKIPLNYIYIGKRWTFYELYRGGALGAARQLDHAGGCTPIPTTKSTTSTRAAASCCWQTPCTTWRPPSLAVIPPGAPHKTEGGPFARFNINVSPDYANPLPAGGPPGPVPWVRSPLSPEEHSAMFPLLEDLERCSPGSRHSGYVIQALFGYLVVLLSRVEAASHQGLTVERPLAAAGAESAGLPVQPLPGKPEPGQSGGPVLCVQSHHPLQL